ncbi:MAG: hypothetical protein E7328_06340 [Clostridiales bacterium]|nr:hypothetical protein [Clostridiales bacterium]
MDAGSGRKYVMLAYVLITLALLTVFLLQRLGQNGATGTVQIFAKKVEYMTKEETAAVHKLPLTAPIEGKDLLEKEERMRPYLEKEGR